MLNRKPSEEFPSSGLPPEQAEQIQAQLERVLSSTHFRTSRRCQSLLRYITERTLAGDAATLKERTLGVEVFGRSADYDTNQEPVVRTTAAEIRKKLAQYYQTDQNGLELRIELQPGSYAPSFHWVSAPHATLASRLGRAWPWWIVAGGAAALAVVVTVAAVFAFLSWSRSDLERFWSPLMEAPGTVLICMGQPIVYNLASAEAQDRIQAQPLDSSAQSGAPPDEAMPRKALIILPDRYIALGDAVCLTRITGWLEKHGKTYRIRGERSTSSSDLRETPAVLIGAFDNPWTLQASGQLRFTFVKDSAHETDMVRDRDHPERTDWKLTGAWPKWDIPNDYAIVSRLLDVNTDRVVVIAAGITHFGTMAAGEFLSNPKYFSEAIPSLRRDWQKKNLQIVLRVPVVRGTSQHPRVLETHVW